MLCGAVTLHCKRKYEVLPKGAQGVQRKDSQETAEGSKQKIIRRDYQFNVGKSTFLCESREFENATAAKEASKQKIAERPEEAISLGEGIYAQSGRSLWMRKENRFVWCMLVSNTHYNLVDAILPLRTAFLNELKK